MTDLTTFTSQIPMVGTALQLALILLLTLAANLILRLATKPLLHEVRRTHVDPERIARLDTLIYTGRSVIFLIVVLIAIAMALQALQIDVAPLIAGAGMIGLALSLGAQTLIKDFIGGLLILIENQFTVGDVIAVGDVSGAVERISLRTTQLRDIQGRLHIIANGDIRVVSNVTAYWSRAIVDFNVDFQADMSLIMTALEQAAKRTADDAKVGADLLEPPQSLGWIGFSDWAIQVRLMVKTKPGKQWGVMMTMRQYGLEELRAAGIRVAVPAQRIHVEPDEPPPTAPGQQ
jgi:small-conductance mechanosensitive channel